MNHIIKINLFGGMSVEVDNVILQRGAGKLHKHWKLLALLAVYKNTTLSLSRLMDIMYNEDEDISNPQSALKNTVYNLRKELGEQSFILFEEGSYKWNNQNELILDIEVFEKLLDGLKDSDMNKKLDIYASIIELYKGDFLPQIYDEEWVVQRSTYYKKKYIDAVIEYLEILYTNERYNEILAVANFVSFIEPYNEDFYLYMFKALYDLNMNSVIVNTYFRVSRIFLDELGVELCSEIKEIYLKASKKVNKIEQDILIIKEDLREATKDQTPIRGAYFCSYEVFKQMYQMVARAADRQKRSIVLLLITITDYKGNIPENPILQNAMVELRDVLKKSLRKGDTFAQYSKAQYILMLATESIEKSKIVVERIEKNYEFYIKQNKLRLISKLSLQDPIT
jgi:DNA-binding SARP family transcriptional activator